MNLLSPLPGPSWLYRIAAYALAALSVFGFGWFKGSAHWHSVLIESQTKAMTEGVRIARARDVVTTRVETKYLPQIVKQQVVTETIVKEVPVYVPLTDPALGAGWRELHDAAADMRLPRPAEELDGADTVPAREASATVARNYGVCNQALIQLREWQEWASQQRKVK